MPLHYSVIYTLRNSAYNSLLRHAANNNLAVLSQEPNTDFFIVNLVYVKANSALAQPFFIVISSKARRHAHKVKEKADDALMSNFMVFW